ncbi:hypothetical protein EDEG_03866 [Edhazardia aedis USNM 41457]|uniref:Uncharacterized protein n=1 Tax=Edhazardia aedis (strain USNM 41457) TaxID=1003232 RepID=J9D180_EDHAE|nr:hypothetical protein EDEG_03866 [Edhazardia aedis USNM 41457]|eukprot:EJW01581.1 hypothetical protein EDEG_03866 [Edhazardia aedis USNM 41457]
MGFPVVPFIVQSILNKGSAPYRAHLKEVKQCLYNGERSICGILSDSEYEIKAIFDKKHFLSVFYNEDDEIEDIGCFTKYLNDISCENAYNPLNFMFTNNSDLVEIPYSDCSENCMNCGDKIDTETGNENSNDSIICGTEMGSKEMRKNVTNIEINNKTCKINSEVSDIFADIDNYNKEVNNTEENITVKDGTISAYNDHLSSFKSTITTIDTIENTCRHSCLESMELTIATSSNSIPITKSSVSQFSNLTTKSNSEIYVLLTPCIILIFDKFRIKYKNKFYCEINSFDFYEDTRSSWDLPDVNSSKCIKKLIDDLFCDLTPYKEMVQNIRYFLDLIDNEQEYNEFRKDNENI